MNAITKNLPRSLRLATVLGLATLALCACSEDMPWSYDAPYPVVATPDSVSTRLADAADKASSALQSLAAVEQQRTPAPLPPAVAANANDDLNKPVTVAWTGPASPLVQRLATRVGYHYEQVGGQPATPVTVTVNVIEQPILEVLRDIGLQAGSRANLVVDANRHVVELDYAK